MALDPQPSRESAAQRLCCGLLQGRWLRLRQLSWVLLRVGSCVSHGKKIWWSDASSAGQRKLQPAMICFPTTASSAQFCLLCCQPEPVPRSLTARTSQPARRDPCRLLAWLGPAIHTVYGTWPAPLHSITKPPKATESMTPANCISSRIPRALVLWSRTSCGRSIPFEERK